MNTQTFCRLTVSLERLLKFVSLFLKSFLPWSVCVLRLCWWMQVLLGCGAGVPAGAAEEAAPFHHWE